MTTTEALKITNTLGLEKFALAVIEAQKAYKSAKARDSSMQHAQNAASLHDHEEPEVQQRSQDAAMATRQFTEAWGTLVSEAKKNNVQFDVSRQKFNGRQTERLNHERSLAAQLHAELNTYVSGIATQNKKEWQAYAYSGAAVSAG